MPSSEHIHMHSCGRVIAAVSASTSLLFCQPRLAGPLFLMVQNKETAKEDPLLVLHPQSFDHYL